MPKRSAAKTRKRTKAVVENGSRYSSSSSITTVPDSAGSAATNIDIEPNLAEQCINQMHQMIFKLAQVVETQAGEISYQEDFIQQRLSRILSYMENDSAMETKNRIKQELEEEHLFFNDEPFLRAAPPDLDLALDAALNFVYRHESAEKMDRLYAQLAQLDLILPDVLASLHEVDNNFHDEKKIADLEYKVRHLKEISTSDRKKHLTESKCLQQKLSDAQSKYLKLAKDYENLKKSSKDKDHTITSLQQTVANKDQEIQAAQNAASQDRKRLCTYQAMSAQRLTEVFQRKEQESKQLAEIVERREPGELQQVALKLARANERQNHTELNLAKQALQIAQLKQHIQGLEMQVVQRGGQPIVTAFNAQVQSTEKSSTANGHASACSGTELLPVRNCSPS